MTKVISFDVGGTTIKYAYVDEQGQVTAKNAFQTVDNADQLISKMVAVIKDYAAKQPVAGVGFSAPGIVRHDGFMVTGGAIQAFNGYPLARAISDQTGLPVTVENDANAAAIAEQWQGNAVGCQNYLTVVLGTGVGGGIVINGDIYRGSHGMAGEFGWNVIHNIDPIDELESFSLNQHAAVVSGLVNRYNQSKRQVMADFTPVTDARAIFTAAKNSDTIAVAEVDAFVQDVAIMLLNLFANFDPELILVGGGISANETFIQLLQAKLAEMVARHESLNRIKDIALGRVKPAKLRNDAGLIGAAYQLRKRLESEAGHE
ncbi:ROK family protein [Lactiplantibacillus sp. WILCCON 0030]|uniref:ROK family protein n=1 Tax=Lactiplantibacillus brownii TaxID=3069269 RepID=A0ABU1AB91_9LACO|nr:ROK family protein [Lactiplantibacillus brownii]MDQ7938234.1 ROK family protein [Lactiplantibacillus brownii]